MEKLHEWFRQRWEAGMIEPLLLISAYLLDFLCVHPFRDGNGRVSRLLFLLLCYHLGLEVGRYISLERLIEQNKERYYETLKLSSEGWHEGKHNPWHYINFLLYTLLDAYKELRNFLRQQLEEGVERVSIPGLIAGKATLLLGQVVPVVVPDLRGMYSWTTTALISALISKIPPVAPKPPTPPAGENEQKKYERNCTSRATSDMSS